MTGDLDDMKEICATCPLLTLCARYAQAAKPRAGFWAGRQTTKHYRAREGNE